MFRPVSAKRKGLFALIGIMSATVAIAVAVLAPPIAVGQATRTWVSGVGDDANPCSRTAPCKTFAGAISKTAPAGEINCLDPGGFGALTITKSLSIICDYTEGGVLASLTNGIIIHGQATDIINLSGLDIEGAGNGLNGIEFITGAALHVRNSIIRGFRSPSAGNGILFIPTNAGAELYVDNSTLEDNGASNVGAGIQVRPSAGGSAEVSLTNVNMENNNIGLLIDGRSTTAAIQASVQGSDASGSTNHGFDITTAATLVTMMIDDSSASNNNGSGILSSGAGALVRVGRTTITGNNVGTNANTGGTIQSYQTNQIRGNVNDGGRTSITQE